MQPEKRDQGVVRVPFLDLHGQYRFIRGEVLSAIEAVWESCRYAQGPQTAEFEKAFAAYCGVKHCVSLNSGTSALHVALRCLDVGPGDEVITVPLTFVATVWAISYVGARPVFVDIDPVRRTLDPEKLAGAITARTKAILPVHLYGMPADMAPILEIARSHGIPVVEDAAQAHGVRYRGHGVGQFGCMAGFSFYPGKNLGGYGEGGALVTDNEEYASRARRLRDHGQSQRYYHDEIGFNYRMDSVQGAVLGVKLRHLDSWNAARASHAERYRELLSGLPLRLPVSMPDARSNWHLFVVESGERDRLRKELSERGVETGLHYPVPVHLQKAYVSLGYRVGDFPVSERVADECLSLPMYAELTETLLQEVREALADAWRGR